MLSDATWGAIREHVQEFAASGIPEAMSVVALKNCHYLDAGETNLFRAIAEVGDLASTTNYLFSLSDQGDRDAPFYLGELAMAGKLNEKQPAIQRFEVARSLLRTALGRGNPSATRVLCVLDYLESLNPNGDMWRRKELAASARQWAKRAADNGDPIGNALYGRMLIEGVGGYIDFESGEDQLLLAVTAGKNVTMPAHSSATAAVGRGGVVGAATSWKVDIQLDVKLRRGGAYDWFAVIDKKNGQVKGRKLAEPTTVVPTSIAASIKTLAGVAAEPGDRFEIVENNGGATVSLFKVVIPPSSSLPQYRLPELDRYFEYFFPGTQMEPGPVARTTPPPTRLLWTSDLNEALRRAKAQGKNLIFIMTDQRAFAPLEKVFFGPGFAEYADDKLVPTIVFVNMGIDDFAPQKILQRRYNVTEFATVIVINSNGAEFGRFVPAPEQGLKEIVLALEKLQPQPQRIVQPSAQQPLQPRTNPIPQPFPGRAKAGSQ